MKKLFALVLLSAAAGWSYTAKQFSTSLCSATSGALTCALGSNIAIGDVIVVGISVRQNGTGGTATAVSTVSDSLSAGTVYTEKVVSPAWATNLSGTAIWAGTATAAGSDSITVTANGTYNFLRIVIAVYDGTDITEVPAGTTSFGSVATNIQMDCATFTPSANNVEIVGVIYDNNPTTGGTIAPNAGYALQINSSSITDRREFLIDSFQSSAASTTPGIHDSAGAGLFSCAAAAFQSPGSVRRRQAAMSSVTVARGVGITATPVLPPWSIVFVSDQHPDPTLGPNLGSPITVNSAYLISKQASWNTQAYLHTGDTSNDFPAGMWNHGWNNIVGQALPTISAIGNHDCLAPGSEDCAGVPASGTGRATTNRTAVFDTQLGYSRVSGASWGPVSAFSGTGNDLGYYPDSTGSRANYAIRFSVNGHKLLVIALELFARDAVMTWAVNLANFYPDHKVIIITHAYQIGGSSGRPCRWLPLPIGPDAYCPGSTSYFGYLRNDGVTYSTGEILRDNMIKLPANVFLTLSGHFISLIPRYSQYLTTGNNGNAIIGFMYNDQEAGTINNTWLGRLIFHEDTATFDFLIMDSATDQIVTSWVGMAWPQ